MAEATFLGIKIETRRIVTSEIPNVNQCPYGKVGDILLVRESFFAFGYWRKYQKMDGGKDHYEFEDQTKILGLDYMYPVGNGPQPTAFWNSNILAKKSLIAAWHIRNSLFMPKAAIRQKLQITSVTIERLQDITEDAAKAEGVKLGANGKYLNYLNGESGKSAYLYDCDTALDSFRKLWKSISGYESWHANPYVYVIKFKLL